MEHTHALRSTAGCGIADDHCSTFMGEPNHQSVRLPCRSTIPLNVGAVQAKQAIGSYKASVDWTLLSEAAKS